MKIYGVYIAAILMLLLLLLQSFSSDPSTMIGYIPLSDRIGEAGGYQPDDAVQPVRDQGRLAIRAAEPVDGWH